MTGRRRGEVLRLFLVPPLVFALLLAIWPAVEAPYLACFRAAAGFTLAVAGLDEVGVERNAAGDEGGNDTRLAYRISGRPGGPTHFYSAFHGKHVAYLPVALFLALLAGGVGGVRRRLRALVGGLLVLDVLACLRLGLRLSADWYAATAAAGSGQMGAPAATWWGSVVGRLDTVIGRDPTLFAFLPFLVWASLSVRRPDWKRWFPTSSS